MIKKKQLIISCEHASNKIPDKYRSLFINHADVLNTHRGFDIGVQDLFTAIIQKFDCYHAVGKYSRLLIDLNRTCDHPDVFSDISHRLTPKVRKEVIKEIYEPYREKVTNVVKTAIENDIFVVHLSMHTFTPILDGEIRQADIGLLYDPSRYEERSLAQGLKFSSKQINNQIIVRMNYPYKGIADGFTQYFRKNYTGSQYVGLEIEVNQKFFSDPEQKDSIILHVNKMLALQLREFVK